MELISHLLGWMEIVGRVCGAVNTTKPQPLNQLSDVNCGAYRDASCNLPQYPATKRSVITTIYSNKIWISGADGRLGSKLVEMLNPVDVEILATDKDTVDVSVSSEVINFADRNRPDYIINCSAITDAGRCEEDKVPHPFYCRTTRTIRRILC